MEKREIFRNDTDRRDFLSRVGEELLDHGCSCLAWALMPNHLHLLVKAGEEGVSRFMQGLLTGYAVSFNLRHDRVGHLFANRYKSIMCGREAYLLELARYIHLNPLRAGIVRDLAELSVYQWCGHGAICGRRHVSWQQTDEMLRHFGETRAAARAAYERFVEEGVGKELPSIFGGTGPADCPAAVNRGEAASAGARTPGSMVPKNDESTSKLRSEDVLEFCASKFGVEAAELGAVGRSRSVSNAKALAIYIYVRYLGIKNKEAARLTCMRDSSASVARKKGRLMAERLGIVDKLII